MKRKKDILVQLVTLRDLFSKEQDKM